MVHFPERDITRSFLSAPDGVLPGYKETRRQAAWSCAETAHREAAFCGLTGDIKIKIFHDIHDINSFDCLIL
jgi:hypothetical protein